MVIFKLKLLGWCAGFLMSALSLPVLAQDYDFKIAVPVPLSSLPNISHQIMSGAAIGLQTSIVNCQKWKGNARLNVQLEYWDDRSDSKQVAEQARNIVKGGAVAVVGHLNSGTAMPASTVYEESGIPNITTGATNPNFTGRGYKTTFRLNYDDFELSRNMVDARLLEFAGPIVLIDDGTSYGIVVVDGFLKSRTWMQSRSEVVRLSVLETEVQARQKQIRTLFEQTGTLVIGGMDLFAKKLLDLLPESVAPVVVGGDGLCSDFMAEKYGRKFDGKMFCISQSLVDESAEYMPWIDSPASSAYQAQYGKPMSLESARAADAVMVLVKSICDTGSLDGTHITDYLRSSSGFEGLTGRIKFLPDGSNKSATGFLHELKSGRWKLKSLVTSAD